MHILWLGDSRAFDVALVGGKVANLSRLAARHRVPPGFCVTTAAYDAAVGARDEGVGEAPDLPYNVAVGARQSPSRPDGRDASPLQGEIALAYRELGALAGSSEPSVAVRSSAVDEDSG